MRDKGRRMRFSVASAAGALALVACGSHYDPPAEVAKALAAVPEQVDYNWHVRPILSQNCFRCHGLAASTRKAGLRLDVADSAFGELPESPGKHAIVPGRPGESELIRRITSTDPDERMPPKEAHKVLAPVEIATLLKWIEQGAKYRQHWAYIPPALVQPQASKFESRATGNHRPIRVRAAREGGTRPFSAGGPRDTDQSRHGRPHRPAADAGGSRRVRRGPKPECV